ncbi:hypothetical protein [Streptomyces sp. CO7]
MYATEADLTDYLDPDPVPANAARLLNRASAKLDQLLIGAVYDTDDDGLPTDPALAEVFREAVCIQAAYIAALGDETGANANVASMTLGNQTITRALGNARGSGGATSTPRVSQDVIDLLKVHGLLPVRPRVRG